MDTFRYDDGAEATREIVSHPGAVTVLPFDGERIWLVRQPREPVGEQSLLELPAGKIDVEGEDLLATAKRELAEEIGKGAREWRHLVSFYNSPGLLAEENHLFLAEDLFDEARSAEEEERIEIVPLDVPSWTPAAARRQDLIGLGQRLRDAKALLDTRLLWFRAARSGARPPPG